jgi:hypothetical protein
LADRARNRRAPRLWLIALALVLASLALGRYAHADGVGSRAADGDRDLRVDELDGLDLDLDEPDRTATNATDERSELATDALDSETEALVALAGLDDALVDGTYLDALDLTLDDDVEAIDTRPASRVGRLDVSLAYRRHDTEQLVLLLATWRL